jgi:hypothetical protein
MLSGTSTGSIRYEAVDISIKFDRDFDSRVAEKYPTMSLAIGVCTENRSRTIRPYPAAGKNSQSSSN